MDSDPYALATISVHHAPPRTPIGTFFRVCFLIGDVAVTISSNLLGPLMGIASVLWLMMRNDSAIDPRVAWMQVFLDL